MQSLQSSAITSRCLVIPVDNVFLQVCLHCSESMKTKHLSNAMICVQTMVSVVDSNSKTAYVKNLFDLFM